MSSISIKDLPQWDGEQITFHSWWKRFQSYAVSEGFSEALQEEFRNKLPRKQPENAFEFDNDPVVKAEQEKAIKKNNQAVYALVMAFTTDSCMAAFYNTQDEDWPFGLAWKVVKTIKDEYQLSGLMMRLELSRRLTQVRMNETDEPRILFEQLEAIKELFEGAPIDIQEEEFIAVVMEKAPAKYASVIATMSVIKKDQLTLNVLFKVMSTFHRMESRSFPK